MLWDLLQSSMACVHGCGLSESCALTAAERGACPYTVAGALVAALHDLKKPLMYADAKRLGSHPEAVLDFVSDLVLTPEPRKTGFVLANLSIVLYALCQPREAGGAGMQPSMLALALTPAVFQLYSDSGTPGKQYGRDSSNPLALCSHFVLQYHQLLLVPK